MAAAKKKPAAKKSKQDAKVVPPPPVVDSPVIGKHPPMNIPALSYVHSTKLPVFLEKVEKVMRDRYADGYVHIGTSHSVADVGMGTMWSALMSFEKVHTK